MTDAHNLTPDDYRQFIFAGLALFTVFVILGIWLWETWPRAPFFPDEMDDDNG